MEEQATDRMTDQASKEEWVSYVDEMLFRLENRPRKWEEWGYAPLEERVDQVFKTTLDRFLKCEKNVRKALNGGPIKLLKHFKLLKKEPPEIQELYLQVFVMLSLVGGREEYRKFSELISHPYYHPDSLLWRQIAIHNLSQEAKFVDLGLSFAHWSNFPGATFYISGERNFDGQWKKLNEELERLEKMFGRHPLLPALRKDCIAIRKRKREILSGHLPLSGEEWVKESFLAFNKSRDHLRKKRCNPRVGAFFEKLRRLNHVWLAIREFKELQKREFTIQLWGRSTPNDLLLGNNIGNCLSIGDKSVFPAVRLPGVPGVERPAGILDYLVDKGIQVVEISEKINEDTFYYAGQCYLYVFLDNGKPVLMADSIDFNLYYHPNRRAELNAGLSEAVFEYLRDYARAVGIKRVVLAKNGPVLESGEKKGQRHEIQNDLEVSDLPVVKFEKIEKFCGYWNHHPYFLESVGGTEAYVIM